MTKTTTAIDTWFPTKRGGWDVVKEKRRRASAHTDRKSEAIDRAREIVKGQGGGEVRIADKHGKFNDSDTKKGPRHKSPAREIGSSGA